MIACRVFESPDGAATGGRPYGLTTIEYAAEYDTDASLLR